MLIFGVSFDKIARSVEEEVGNSEEEAAVVAGTTEAAKNPDCQAGEQQKHQCWGQKLDFEGTYGIFLLEYISLSSKRQGNWRYLLSELVKSWGINYDVQ